MKRILGFVLFFAGLFSALPAEAQFLYGKNQVMWEKTEWTFYRSEHFDFYLAMDIADQEIQPHVEELAKQAEEAYGNLSSSQNHELKRRPLIFVTRTHSQFEGAIRIHGDPFMPEGVGAFAMPRGALNDLLLLVVKLDFLPSLNHTILVHELEHIFEFDMIGGSILQRVTGIGFPDGWIFEAVSDYMANRFVPYTRDDIRRDRQRVGAANAANRYAGFPTLLGLKAGINDPYAMGALVFMYLEDKFGVEPVEQLIQDIFKTRQHTFENLLMDMSRGEFRTPEMFDRAHRDFWAKKFEGESDKRAQPYSDTDNFKGRQIVRFPGQYPYFSPDNSPDGKSISTITISDKNGIVVATLPALPRDDPEYETPERRKKYRLFGPQVQSRDPRKDLQVLTGYMPPKPYEQISVQNWTQDGSDQDWWQEPVWVAKVKDVHAQLDELKKELTELRKDNKKDLSGAKPLEEKKKELEKALEELYKVKGVSLVAFFGKKNRDHNLFIYDVNDKNMVQDIEIPLDQAFSPAFCPDGKRLYFSASKKIKRNIYVMDLATKDIRNLTGNDRLNHAPAVSPDETKIVYTGLVGDYQKLFLLDLVLGTKEQLTFGRWNDTSPSWSGNGKKIVFTSDEKDIIWNLYTMDMETRTVSQWTDFYGGVYGPKFAAGEDDRIVFSALYEQDQFLIFIYPNFELFDVKLKSPIRTFIPEDSGVSMQYAVNHESAVTGKLDKRQLEHPEKPPRRWKFYGRDLYISRNSYWGTSVYTQVQLQDVFSEHTHSGLFARSGDLRFYDYTFTNQSRRLVWAASLNHSQYPLRYFMYNFTGQQPRYPDPNGKIEIFTFKNVWATETSATIFVQYPFNKWDRVEFGLRPRKRDFRLPFNANQAERDYFRSIAPPEDIQIHDFFNASGGQTNLGVFTAVMHDTSILSPEVMGPLHGTATRIQLEVGPALNGRSSTHATVQADLRRYLRVTNSTVLAARLAGIYSTRPSGEFLGMGDNGQLHGYPYFSVFGNRVAYGGAEFRFPVASASLFDAVPFKIRGTFFGDYAIARFTDDILEQRREWSYGAGIQVYLIMPMNFEFTRTRFDPNRFNFNFRIGYSF